MPPTYDICHAKDVLHTTYDRWRRDGGEMEERCILHMIDGEEMEERCILHMMGLGGEMLACDSRRRETAAVSSRKGHSRASYWRGTMQ